MNFDINPSSPIPIFRQIVEQVQRSVASGQLRAGDALASVRSVAQLHAINPMTVSKAYSLLETEGVLSRMRGVGMVIAERKASHQDKLALLRPALLAASQIARQLEISDADAQLVFLSCLNELNEKVVDENQ